VLKAMVASVDDPPWNKVRKKKKPNGSEPLLQGPSPFPAQTTLTSFARQLKPSSFTSALRAHEWQLSDNRSRKPSQARKVVLQKTAIREPLTPAGRKTWGSQAGVFDPRRALGAFLP